LADESSNIIKKILFSWARNL